VVALACVSLTLAACSSSGGGSAGGTTTITLEGPNQWTSSGSTFGPAWEALVTRFEKDNPKIKVKTVVLPISEFNQTISTQLAAGTAPELVFNQASYKPYMVHHLDSDLTKPNPYVPGNKQWIDVFKPKAYGLKLTVDPEGHVDYVPFNMFTAGVFYNKDAFAKADVQAPITTFANLLTACGKLKSAGYTPFAMDDSDLGVGWTWQVVSNMLLNKDYNKFNYFDATGKPGTNPTLTQKDLVRATATGQLTTKTPEVAESLKLMKQFFDQCATKNWSGIKGTSGSMVNVKDFVSGKAAMTWGTDFAGPVLTNLGFKYATMPFSTIMKATTPLSTNAPAQKGVSLGGTSYMIPAKVSGDKLKAAIKFLQYVSAPTKVEPWLKATGAIPVLNDAPVPAQSQGLVTGAWAQPLKIGGTLLGPSGTTGVSMFDGYLLGSKNLSQEQSYLQQMWGKSASELIKNNLWDKESWAKNAK
jgi:multiple sugar transport system substrate-binding protein